MTKPSVSIVGSGIVGMSIAIQLQKNGFPTTLIGSAPRKNTTMHFALHPKNYQFLSNIGINCPSKPVSQMNLYFDQTPIILDARKSLHSHLCHIVRQHDLVSACIHHPLLSQLRWIKSSPSKLHNRTLTVNSEQIKSDILIACDGTQSWLRQQTSITVEEYHYQQYAHIALLSLAKPLHSADQYFCSQGIIAFLPCQNPHQAMLIWSCSSDLHHKIIKNGLKHHIKNCPTPSKVIQVTQHQYTPLNAMLASTYQHQNILLAGNSLHTIHPLAGMGLNLGIRDGVKIVDILKKRKNLEFYTTEREKAHLKAHWITHTLAKNHTSIRGVQLIKTIAQMIEPQLLNFVDTICL